MSTQCSTFWVCAAVIRRIAQAANVSTSGDVSLALEVRDAQGRTDLELRVGDALFIFEAKRAWQLPTQRQLAQYAGRIGRDTPEKGSL